MPRGFRVLIMLAALGAASPLAAQVVVSCAANGGGGDLVSRGFYVQNYSAGTLNSVTLQYIGSTAGTYTVTLTANAGAYNGPLIGMASATAAVAASGDTAVTFNFPSPAVAPGSTIAFTQNLVSGPGALFFDIGNGALGVMDNTCPGVIETEGTTPPLDIFRRNSVALSITGSAGGASAAPIPTLGAAALLMLALALAASAALRRRRA